MSDFDLVVVGGGAANNLATAVARNGYEVALVEERALGGTCLTRGCNPSKALVQRARRVDEVRSAGQFGVEAELIDVDFSSIVAESNEPYQEEADHIAEHMRDAENLALYEATATFVDARTLSVDDEEITGERTVVAAGARPTIPPIDGIEDVDYVTSDGVLRLDERPDHLVVVGGGYVAAEMGYVYGALGSDVTILGRSDRLLPAEDEEVSERFTEVFAERFDVRTGHEVTEVTQDGDEITATVDADGNTVAVTGDELLVATGRRPNTDRLDVEAAGLETDDDGFLEVDEYLETSVDGIWAVGDIAGNHMFWHSALQEAEHVYRAIVEDRREPVEYPGMAHAVFASPEVAGTGATETELADEGREYAVGRHEYADTPMGQAIKEDDGFVKVLADPDSGELLGCHIVGPHASTLIHQVTMATDVGDASVGDVADAIHIHPALNEVVASAFDDV